MPKTLYLSMTEKWKNWIVGGGHNASYRIDDTIVRVVQ